ncbi:hypothetical protein M427DRAFT_150528 [Gonapodya prolifera JEL478]|uniref:DRBM domain-containing protein n=1 Tax=Gonapodya prolifera (strain JEL478) TaxID=1344416 RepID=A0A139B0D7_GONPJ|nr:hypothetical protein M427DRAFT_150528 [Gonapodya prolifera JEL478]|eukprot:KXS22165.1 hypothetical protein M427DRAFT_150528 [Gonapodya prolifera JEL478]
MARMDTPPFATPQTASVLVPTQPVLSSGGSVGQKASPTIPALSSGSLAEGGSGGSSTPSPSPAHTEAAAAVAFLTTISSPTLRGVVPTYTPAQQAMMANAPTFIQGPFTPSAPTLPNGRTPVSSANSPISRVMETCARMGLGLRPPLECSQLPHSGWLCRDNFLGKNYESRHCYGRKQDAREDVGEQIWWDLELARMGGGPLAEPIRARGIKIPPGPLDAPPTVALALSASPSPSVDVGSSLPAAHMHPVSRLKEYSERRRMTHSFILEELREGGTGRYRQRAKVGDTNMPWSGWHGSKKAAKEEAARLALMAFGMVGDADKTQPALAAKGWDAMSIDGVQEWSKALNSLVRTVGREGVIRKIVEEKVKGVEENLRKEVERTDNRVKVVASNAWGSYCRHTTILNHRIKLVLYLQSPPQPRLDALRPTNHLLQVLHTAAEKFATSRSRPDAVQNVCVTQNGVSFFYYGQPFDVVLCAEVRRLDLEKYLGEVLHSGTIPEWEKKAAVWDWSAWYAREGSRWAVSERTRERERSRFAGGSGGKDSRNNRFPDDDESWRPGAKMLKFMVLSHVWPADKAVKDAEELFDWVGRGAWDELTRNNERIPILIHHVMHCLLLLTRPSQLNLSPPNPLYDHSATPAIVSERRPFVGDGANPFANWADGNDVQGWTAVASWAKGWLLRLGQVMGVEVALGPDEKAAGGAGAGAGAGVGLPASASTMQVDVKEALSGDWMLQQFKKDEFEVKPDESEVDGGDRDLWGVMKVGGVGMPPSDTNVLRLLTPTCTDPVRLRFARFNIRYNLDRNAGELFPVYILPATPSPVLEEVVRRGVHESVLAAIALYCHCEVDRKSVKGDVLVRGSATFLNGLKPIYFAEAEPGNNQAAASLSALTAGQIKFEVAAGMGRTLAVTLYVE